MNEFRVIQLLFMFFMLDPFIGIILWRKIALTSNYVYVK